MYAEVTAAWLQAVREQYLSWGEYQRYLQDFHQDLERGFLRTWQDDDLLPGVLAVQERITRMYREHRRGTVPILHTHDAYYVALAEAIRRDSEERVVLVTNDARVWRGARVLGIEVFHGNTCDLGTDVLYVGSPGQDFPEGANCCPCAAEHCPSGFIVDLETLPTDLGSGTPRSLRERRTSSPQSG